MRIRVIVAAALGLAVVSTARAQIDLAGPSASGGGPGATLAQFQPGISPFGTSFNLGPGQTTRLALYCIDLFAGRPTDRVTFAAPGSDAVVRLASGDGGTLGEAMTAGLIHARGSGPRDPALRRGGQWFDVVLTNTNSLPVSVSVPVGTLLVPTGQSIPEVRPTVRRLFAAARGRGLLGTDTLAHAVWATRGFSREDVEQTTMTALSDPAAKGVQTMLAEANLGFQFDRGAGEYARLFEQKRVQMVSPEPFPLLAIRPERPATLIPSLAATPAAPVTGTAILPDGKTALAEVLAEANGDGLVKLTRAQAPSPFYYSARIQSRLPDRMTVALLHLKTGRPLEAALAPILIRLAAS
jgi:hypothetical protein